VARRGAQAGDVSLCTRTPPDECRRLSRVHVADAPPANHEFPHLASGRCAVRGASPRRPSHAGVASKRGGGRDDHRHSRDGREASLSGVALFHIGSRIGDQFAESLQRGAGAERGDLRAHQYG
jgi:hypothetical protein